MSEETGCGIWGELVATARAHPEAIVACSAPNGQRMVSTPSDIRELFVDEFPTQAVMRNIHQDDKSTIIALWATARVSGSAHGRARSEREPRQSKHYFLFDLVETHGVMVTVVAPSNESDIDLPAVEPAPVKIRRTAFTCDATATMETAEHSVTDLLGYPLEQFVGTSLLDLVHPDDVDVSLKRWADLVIGAISQIQVPVQLRTRSGSWAYVEATCTSRISTSNDILVELVDISAEMEAHARLREREDLLNRLTSALPTGIAHFDGEGLLVFFNERLVDIVGTVPSTLEEYVRHVDPSDEASVTEILGAATERAEDAELEISIVNSARSENRRCKLSLRALVDADGGPLGVLCCLDDVTESWELHGQLAAQATTDSLTNVSNRSAVLALLDETLEGGDGSTATVFFFDLNSFKEINDELGHKMGDAVLCDFSERLKSVSRPGDLVGRLGGDEFVVVARGVSERDAEQLAARLTQAVNGRRCIDGLDVIITASCGYSVSSGSGVMTADALIAEADAAMYEQKRSGDRSPRRYIA